MKKRRRRDLSALHRRSYGNSDKERPKIGIARGAAIAYRATAAGAFDVAPRTHPSRSNAWKAERDRRAHVEAERDRQAHVTSLAGTASNRAATAKSSTEEMKRRMAQREAAQKPGAATAHLTFANECPKHIALLEGEEAAEAMLSRPTRLPNLILQSPHEAAPSFHEDWTRVEGSAIDPEKWKKELRLRDSRNRQRGRRLQQRQRLQQPLHLAQPHNAGVLRHPLLALPPDATLRPSMRR